MLCCAVVWCVLDVFFCRLFVCLFVCLLCSFGWRCGRLQADLSVAVKQIDWESSAGGRGSVDSLLVNGVEMLPAPVYPSQAYVIGNYPHCDDMFNIFPPFGNGVIGPEGRKSIIPEITSNTLPIYIHFSWTGPHDTFPVCSMAGVSVTGYAEINIYLEAQDNTGATVWTVLQLCKS